jgi:hypothetical protein
VGQVDRRSWQADEPGVAPWTSVPGVGGVGGREKRGSLKLPVLDCRLEPAQATHWSWSDDVAIVEAHG